MGSKQVERLASDVTMILLVAAVLPLPFPPGVLNRFKGSSCSRGSCPVPTNSWIVPSLSRFSGLVNVPDEPDRPDAVGDKDPDDRACSYRTIDHAYKDKDKCQLVCITTGSCRLRRVRGWHSLVHCGGDPLRPTVFVCGASVWLLDGDEAILASDS